MCPRRILHTGRENMKPCRTIRKSGSLRHCYWGSLQLPLGRLVIIDNITRKDNWAWAWKVDCHRGRPHRGDHGLLWVRGEIPINPQMANSMRSGIGSFSAGVENPKINRSVMEVMQRLGKIEKIDTVYVGEFNIMLNYDSTALFLNPQASLYTHERVKASHRGNYPSLQFFRNS